MIKKQYVKSRNVTKVTFEHPVGVEADAIELISDVHDWRPVPFDRLKNGKWKLVQEFAPGTVVQFRYRISHDGSVSYWNDDDADGVAPNDQGTDNSILRC